MDCCEKCKYFRVLKHNFETGKGFELSHACVLYAEDSESFIIEVVPQDMCEMFTEVHDG